MADVAIMNPRTWDALALDGPGDDGERLMAGLTQHLAQLLHAVAVHDDGVPAAETEEERLFKGDVGGGGPPQQCHSGSVIQWQ